MRLLTWNINGLRSIKTSLRDLVYSLDSDIICFQETKVDREHLESQYAIVEGFNSYFSFSKKKSGYSGVAIFVRDEWTPWKSDDSLCGGGSRSEKNENETDFIGGYEGINESFTDDELLSLDSEGRCVMTQHKIIDKEKKSRNLIIINVYCPRADVDNEERIQYKLAFYKILQTRAETLVRKGNLVIILGDINTSHKMIDHCSPGSREDFENNESRRWMDQMLFEAKRRATDDASAMESENLGNYNETAGTEKEERSRKRSQSITTKGGYFVDMLRLFHPTTPHLFTNWCSPTGARQTNYGCRLDYILADLCLALDLQLATFCYIRPDIHGSDHCPVAIDLDVVSIPATKCPSLCSKFYPQFSGKQLKLASFLVKESADKILGRNSSVSGLSCDFDDSVALSALKCNEENNDILKRKSNADAVKLKNKKSSTKNKLKKNENKKNKGIQMSIKSFVEEKYHETPWCNEVCGSELEGIVDIDSYYEPNDSMFTVFYENDVSSAQLLENVCNLPKNCPESLSKESDQFHKAAPHATSSGETSPIDFSSRPPLTSFTCHQSAYQSNATSFFPTLKTTPHTNQTFNAISASKTTATTTAATATANTATATTATATATATTAASTTVTATTDATFSCTTTSNNKSTWKQLLKGPPEAPLCAGHREACLLRVVKKEGSNLGRSFWVCRKPPGHRGDPQASCNTFVWLN